MGSYTSNKTNTSLNSPKKTHTFLLPNQLMFIISFQNYKQYAEIFNIFLYWILHDFSKSVPKKKYTIGK